MVHFGLVSTPHIKSWLRACFTCHSDRKSTPFVYLLLTNGIPFTYLEFRTLHPCWAFSRPKWPISLTFDILQLLKSLPFHIPEAWKRYPFRAEHSGGSRPSDKWEARSSRPWDKGEGRGGGGLKNNSALRASVWSKNKWGGGGGPGPSPGSLDPPLKHSRIGHYREYPPDV